LIFIALGEEEEEEEEERLLVRFFQVRLDRPLERERKRAHQCEKKKIFGVGVCTWHCQIWKGKKIVGRGGWEIERESKRTNQLIPGGESR
jgi:hypothetical protein